MSQNQRNIFLSFKHSRKKREEKRERWKNKSKFITSKRKKTQKKEKGHKEP